MKNNQPNTAATGRRRTEIEKENKFPKIKWELYQVITRSVSKQWN
jgi:hypothetical protein